MKSDDIILFIVIASLVHIFAGYGIYGWWMHRSFRDRHYKLMQSEMKMQTIYLKLLTETLAGEKLAEARQLKKDDSINSKEAKSK
jgi:hypothetical protein